MDRDLVERARAGDRDAFAHLVHQVSDRLYAVAFRILRDTGLAEDALQNALVTAWRQIPHLRDADRFDAWIHRVLINSCYVEARRTRQWTARVRALPDHDGPSTPDASRAAADRDELERAFRRLPIDQRSVFVLHHYVGLPLVEIAETLGIPAGTARSRLHYATRALRSAVEAGPRDARRGRTPGMTDDLHFERLARDWLELGPGRGARPSGPGRPPRDRDDPPGAGSPVPVEVPTSCHASRALVAAAMLVGLAAGGALFLHGSQRRPRRRPSSSPSASLPALGVDDGGALDVAGHGTATEPSQPRSPAIGRSRVARRRCLVCLPDGLDRSRLRRLRRCPSAMRLERSNFTVGFVLLAANQTADQWIEAQVRLPIPSCPPSDLRGHRHRSIASGTLTESRLRDRWAVGSDSRAVVVC